MPQHFVTDETDRIDLDDGFWVDIKKRMSYGDQQKLVAHYIKVRTTTAEITSDIDLAGGQIVLLEINIKGWNLVDANNKVAPLNRANIEKLDIAIATRIATEIDKRNQLPKV